MLDGIEGIMNLAAASGEDLALTSDIVTDALTAFGLTAKDSGHFADVLAAASSNANTNVSMMGTTFRYAAPIAGALGYSAEDVAVAIGLMANSGIKADMAGTSLRKMMTELTGEIKISGKSLGDVMVQTTNADGSMRSLSDILTECRAAFAKLTDSEKAQTAEALVGKTAMSGFLAIMNASEADVRKLTTAVDNCDGSSKKMAETMQDNLNGQITILKSALQELAIQIGDALMPSIRNVVSKIQEWVISLQQMDPETRNAILKVAALAAAIGPLLIVIGMLTNAIGSGISAFASLGKGILTFIKQAELGVGAGGKLKSAIMLLNGPIGIIVAAIGVLVAAFMHLWDTNEEFRKAVTKIWDSVKLRFEALVDKIGVLLDGLKAAFDVVLKAIGVIWDGFCQLLAPVIEGALKYVATVINTVLDVIIDVFDIFCDLFTGNWSGLWLDVQMLFHDIWNGVTSLFKNILDTLKGLADVFLGWFGTNWQNVWTGIANTFQAIWNGITAFFTGVWTVLKTVVTTVLGAIGTAITTGFTAIKTVFTTIWTAIKDNLSSVWEAIKNIVQVGIMFIKELFSAAGQLLLVPFQFIWENCRGIVESVWNAIKTTISTALTAIQTVITTVWNAITAVISTVLTAISSTVTTIWNGIKSFLGTVMTAIATAISDKWNAIKKSLDSLINAIKTGILTAWDAIKTSILAVLDAVNTKITEIWTAIKDFFGTILNEIENVITSAWDSIKSSVISVTTAIQQALTTAWNAIKKVLSTITESIKTVISEAWQGIRDVILSVTDAIKQKLLTVWNAIKTQLETVSTAIKESMNTAWTAIKDTIANLLGGIQDKVKTVWSNITSAIATAVSKVKEKIASGFTAAKDTVYNIFASIGSKINSVMEAAKNKVQTAIEKIKSFFKFSWSLPKLKLPHVKITGRFSLSPPSVPHFSIQWYKKAMENGMILDSPTIFGMKGNQLLAGGEAGSEAVVGTQSLMEMIRNAVNAAGGTTINYGGVNINVYQKENQDIRALADEIEYRINNNVMRRRAAYGT